MHLISVIIVNTTKYTSLKQLLKTEAVSQLNGLPKCEMKEYIREWLTKGKT